jgi:hypothetical protein
VRQFEAVHDLGRFGLRAVSGTRMKSGLDPSFGLGLLMALFSIYEQLELAGFLAAEIPAAPETAGHFPLAYLPGKCREMPFPLPGIDTFRSPRGYKRDKFLLGQLSEIPRLGSYPLVRMPVLSL